MTAAGFAALHLLRPGVAEAVGEWVADLPVEAEQRLAQGALAWLLLGGPRRVQLLGATAFSYAALFTVEAIGLLLQKRWAELLVIVATSSLLPFEGYAVIIRVTLLRVAILIINIAIVAYLVRRVRKGG